MKKILHIVTHPGDPVATAVIAHQRAEGRDLVVRDLSQELELDYGRLVIDIFEADSVQVW